MSKNNLDIIVYPTPPGNPLAKYTWNFLDRFYEACGSTREGVIKFIRGLHKNFHLDKYRDSDGKWPSKGSEIWKNIPLGELIYDAYMGSQKAAWNLIKRYEEINN